VVFCMLYCFISAERITIKINRDAGESSNNAGSHSYSPPAASQTNNQYPPQTPVVKRPAAAYAPPPGIPEDTEASTAWQSLLGTCVTLEAQQGNEQYVYALCPFQNVTQKKPTGSLHVVLGTWLEWRTNAETNALRMLYSDGNLCSSGRHRQTTVHLLCDPTRPVPAIANVAEPETCSYELDFITPLACLPGFRAEGVDVPVGIIVDNALSPTQEPEESLPATPQDCESVRATMKSCLDKLIPALETSEQPVTVSSRSGRSTGKSQVSATSGPSGLSILRSTTECEPFRTSHGRA